MEKIIVNKELLKNYKYISIGLENCDVYKIATEDVIDLYCEAQLISGNEYQSSDGFIKISKRASQTIEHSTLKNNLIGTEWDRRLKERLKVCDDGTDMTSFSLEGGRKKVNIYVPYDPLEDIFHGSEIELSNCPSYKLDDNGNMLIEFGESSKQPRRKDNNYSELIEGWKDAFGKSAPSILRVKIEEMANYGEDGTIFIFSFKIRDRFCKRDNAEFVFMDCKDINVKMFYPQKGDCEITMSKMIDGRIYVGFSGLGVDFTCSSVLEYDCYCNKIGDK